jgi:hypothetical protein
MSGEAPVFEIVFNPNLTLTGVDQQKISAHETMVLFYRDCALSHVGRMWLRGYSMTVQFDLRV